MKHDKWFSLESELEGEPWQGEVRIEVQWIYSRVAFFDNVMARLGEALSYH